MRISLETLALLGWFKDPEVKTLMNIVEFWRRKNPWAPTPSVYFKNKRFIAYEAK